MQIVLKLVDFILNIDVYLGTILQNFGPATYIILFLVVFCETGLVFLPFLPGDSLIFAAGAFAAMGSLNVFILYFVLLLAAFLGDTVNYHIGKKLGNKIENLENRKLIKKEHLEKTEQFFQKHGGKSIILARFIPIVRTFAPFVAGSGKMKYTDFIKYNIIGSILWVSICTFAGYFFGNIPVVKENFSTIILAIIFISVLPILISFVKSKLTKTKVEIKEPA